MYVPGVVYDCELIVAGVVIEFEAELHGPVPIALVALTLNVYDVEPVNPVTVIGDDVPVAVMLPGVLVAV